MSSFDKSMQLITPDAGSSLSEWLTYMQHIHVSAIDMGLSRVLPVAEHLGIVACANDAYVFMVAGTNGKGSTTASIAQICEQAGYKTALYQSPHLLDFNERVRINGDAVGDAVLITAFEQVEQARLACGLSLSFFEMTTLAALLIFAKAECDVWVLEVGLGGRLDVVNIIDADVAVITNVGIDHVDWLGDTREQIGFEKAGILRQDIMLIYGETDMPASVQQQIQTLSVHCYQAGQDFDFLADAASVDTSANSVQKWQFGCAAVTMQLPRPRLSLVNCSNAIAAVLASKLIVSQDHIAAAMRAVSLAGRFDRRQLVGRQWLFDVAHNERGVAFLLQQLLPWWQAHQQQHPHARLFLLFSMLADKDIAQVVQLLVHSGLPIEHWFVAEIDHPRAANQSQLHQVLQSYLTPTDITYATDLPMSSQQAIAASSASDLILVCGSFHTIAETLRALQGAQTC